MNEHKISFSSDNGNIARTDLDVTRKMTEDYFGTSKDPNQISATPKNSDWIYNNCSNYINIIRNEDEIIGYALILPCNTLLMNQFINNKINEATLFEHIKKIKFNTSPEALYLCSSFFKEEFRGKGLATSAFVKIINKITQKAKEKPVLFYWEYSSEGGKLARKLSSLTGLELKVKKD